MDIKKLNTSTKFGFSSAISIGTGVLFASIPSTYSTSEQFGMNTLGGKALTITGLSSLVLGTVLALTAAYLAVNSLSNSWSK